MINSEDMYTQVANEVLAEHGKPLLPWSVKIQLQGRPGPDAAQMLIDWAKLPLTPQELFALTSKKQAELWPTTQFLPGALELIQELRAKNIPIALATSSHLKNYELKTNHLRHGFDLFGEHVVVGDDPRVPKGRGKPFPDIWLTALESLNKERRALNLEEISPAECLVFEDGVSGVEAGKAAGCNIIWVPHPEALKVLGDQAHDIISGHELLGSLTEFDRTKYGLH